MDHAVTLARHFARLVWLLLHDAGSVDEQKAQLRAIVTLAKGGGATLEPSADSISADGTPLAAALSGVREVAEQMAVHSVASIYIDANALAADVLGAARTLATPSGRSLSSSPGASVRFAPRDALPDLDLGVVIELPLTASGRPTPQAAAIGPMPGADPLVAELDELAALVEDAARAGNGQVATEIAHRIVRRERDARNLEMKRAFVFIMRRLSAQPVLQAVVTELLAGTERRDAALAVLARTGEDGADAVIDAIANPPSREARDLYVRALARLPAAIPTLIQLLGDPRWHVARNAATLLGEMQAAEAERPLEMLLNHDDERVRHAAIGSLMRLGTPKSMQTIQEAFRDKAPQIRMQAATALVARADVRTAALLLRALDAENDDEVAAAFLIALGRLAKADAVDRLIATAEADRSLFRKKPVALRVAAIQGLAEAGTPEAIAALETLQHDNDEDVRATAVYALGRVARSARR
ncbi:MAG: HEAT repeat domain-containing protein [Gemmatimonadaceae bacterium]